MKARTMALSLSLIALSGFASAQTVTDIVPRDPTRSGLVRLYGSNFGDWPTNQLFLVQLTGARNSARIAMPVHIASWRPNLVEFYIPDRAAIQPTGLFMGTPSGNRFLGTLSIRSRTGLNGRLKWRFQAADQYISTRPAIGPDGTVYAIGNFGHLYALTPDGGLKWVWSRGADGAVDVGPDGTIYCAGGGGIQALRPDGTLKWLYVLKSAILAGPSVGPDGNIYAADNSRWNPVPTGAVVLSPTGQELWTGGVFYERGGPHQTEVQFDQNRAYIWSRGDTATGAVGGLHAIHLGGGLDWLNPDIVGLQPSGYATGGVVAHGTSTTQRMATGGNPVWSFNLWDIGGSQPQGDVVSAPAGGAFFLTANTRLNALNANGTLRFSNPLGGVVSNLTRSPSAATLLVQRASNFGQPFRIEAYSASSGGFLWASESLPIEFGMSIAVYNRMKYSADGSTVFFGTAGPYTSQFEAHCYVYGMSAL